MNAALAEADLDSWIATLAGTPADATVPFRCGDLLVLCLSIRDTLACQRAAADRQREAMGVVAEAARLRRFVAGVVAGRASDQ